MRPFPMKSLSSIQSSPVLPDFEPDSSQARHDGFKGLNATEQASRAEILFRAYSIWESKGRQNGSQLADWFEAETEVLSETH